MPISKIPLGAIESGTISTSQIADNAVTTAKILNDNVTSAKIPNDAVGSTEIAASAITRDELQSAAVNNISSDSIILNSTNGTADAGDFLVLDGTDGSSSNANHRILFDETFVDKVGLFNINSLGSAGDTLKVNSAGNAFEFGASEKDFSLIQSITVSNSANFAFDNTKLTGFDNYIVKILDLVPASNSVNFHMYGSTDNGNSFVTGAWSAAGYYFAMNTTGSGQWQGGNNQNYINMGLTSGNAGSYGACYQYEFFDLNSSEPMKWIHGQLTSYHNNGNQYGSWWGARGINTGNLNYLKWQFSSGNITTAKVSLYGVRR